MRSRTSLVLMEQLIMILVFSLAAALCMQAFVLADRISRENGQRDRAVFEARNVAEILKMNEGDIEKASQEIGGFGSPELWCVCYDEDWNKTENQADCMYCLEIHRLDEVIEGLGQAQVCVVKAGEQTDVLISLTVAWQEVGE